MLSAESISQGYRTRTVLHDVSLRLDVGTTALLGPNGAGKTTLLQTLATVLPPRRGRLVIRGADVRSDKQARIARRSIGYLPQNFGYDPTMTAFEFVQYGAWARGVPQNVRGAYVQDALQYVGLTGRASDKLGRLSGGMRQRAGIAWAIVGKPPITLLDEPTVGLDPEQRLDFRDLIRGLTETAVLLSTHLTDDIDAVCERVLVMNGGVIIFDGLTSDLKKMATGSRGDTDIEKAYVNLLETHDTSL